jgi:hypothetical protein
VSHAERKESIQKNVSLEEMFDIFNEDDYPKLYIADIHISVKIPTRSKKNKEYFTRNFMLEKYPITLLDGKIPTKRIADRLNSHIYEKHIKSGDMSNMIFKLESISNIRFSSNLAYKFDYSIH